MDKIIIEEIKKSYCQKYNEIFNYMDPRLEADRFNEENQTVNFCRALQEIYNDAIVWYEYPWKTEKKVDNIKDSCNRFDAVVYCHNEKFLFIIEAKCLRKKSKYEALNIDLERICGKNNYKRNGNKVIINIPKPKKIYSVILADYWHCEKSRSFKDIHKKWNNLIETNNDEFAIFKKHVQNWIAEPIWIISEPKTFAKYENYYLMAMIGEIKNVENLYTFNQ